MAEHIYLKQQVAVKVLHLHLAQQESPRFLHEAQTIARLKHPNIISVSDFGSENNTPFLVMDYVPHSLRKRHPLGTIVPLDTIVSYVKQVADALQYAHDAKVLHRDVKPENILITDKDRVILSDFGFAMAAHESISWQALPPLEDIGGSPGYMAPEQWQGKPCRESDQYALGIVVYEWLCGERPFRGTLTELWNQHLSVLPSSLREKNPAISPDIEQIVLKALAKDPERRFESVRAFAHQLVAAFEEAATLGPSHPAMIQEANHKEKRLPPVKQELQAPTSPAVAPTPLAQPNPDPPVVAPPQFANTLAFEATDKPPLVTYAHLSDHGHLIIWSPDRARLASTGRDGTVRIRDATTGKTLLVIPGALSGQPYYDYNAHLTWSPDGRLIAFCTQTLQTQVWEISSGKPLQRLEISRQYSWSPNGRLIASRDNLPDSFPAEVLVWETSRGKLLQRLKISFHSFSWSPDGRLIASVSKNGRSIEVWEATSGKLLQEHEGWRPDILSSTHFAWSPDGRLIASVSKNGRSIEVWEATSGKLLHCYDDSPLMSTILSTWRAASDKLSRSDMRSISSVVSGISWSPDGRLIASVSKNRDSVKVWEATSGKLLHHYRGHSETVASQAWSPDGRLIVWSSEGHMVASQTWSPDGRLIASASEDHTVQVWEATSGKLLHHYKDHSNKVSTVKWSPNGQLIVSCDETEVRLWEAASGKTLYSHIMKGNPRWPVTFLPDSGLLILEIDNKTAQVREAISGKHRALQYYEDHAEYISSVAWSLDGRLLASLSESGTVQVWEALSGGYKQLYRYDDGYSLYQKGFSARPPMVWLSDRRLLVLRRDEQGIKPVKITSGSPPQHYEGYVVHKHCQPYVYWSPNGQLIASEEDFSERVQVWEALSGKLLHRFENQSSFAWSPDGQLLASGGKTGTVQVQEATSGKVIWANDDHLFWLTTTQAPLLALAWSPDGQLIASVSRSTAQKDERETLVQVWEASSGRPLYHYKDKDHSYSSWPFPLSWSPDSQLVTWLSEQNCKDPNPYSRASPITTIQVWEATSGKLLHRYRGHSETVTSQAWSPDGRLIASASEDHTVQVWEAATGTVLFVYRGHLTGVHTVAWSPDGEYIASAAYEVHIWRAP